jgi:hypothetical protein
MELHGLDISFNITNFYLSLQAPALELRGREKYEYFKITSIYPFSQIFRNYIARYYGKAIKQSV